MLWLSLSGVTLMCLTLEAMTMRHIRGLKRDVSRLKADVRWLEQNTR